jgi:hypothetical protein
VLRLAQQAGLDLGHGGLIRLIRFEQMTIPQSTKRQEKHRTEPESMAGKISGDRSAAAGHVNQPGNAGALGSRGRVVGLGKTALLVEKSKADR